MVVGFNFLILCIKQSNGKPSIPLIEDFYLPHPAPLISYRKHLTVIKSERTALEMGQTRKLRKEIKL